MRNTHEWTTDPPSDTQLKSAELAITGNGCR
jgi:hypothetical protein